MPRYTAQVWVSGDHPYDAEINAQNVFQARKNIARREGVSENDVNRVFLVEEDDDDNNHSSSGSIDIGGAGAIAGLVISLWLLVEFTPWILMFGLGAAGAWIGEKVTGQSIEEYAESDDDTGHGAISVVLILSLVLGGLGYVKGHDFQQSFKNDDTTEVQQ